ncbi:hypothetical protein SB775_18230 [Peribacillus sp. SIMBA_075]|uniref:hypothetical protein n=1 Tax=Peribacillus sp. SIMBA_075 TaxID=3085813 RepID=UPI00397D70E7
MNYSGDDGEKIGGGLHVFSLDEIKEVQEIDYLSEHGIPIAHLLKRETYGVYRSFVSKP